MTYDLNLKSSEEGAVLIMVLLTIGIQHY